MKLSSSRINGNFDGRECYVHARIGAFNNNELVMTMQKLDVTGSDFFGDICVSESHDGGITWSEPKIDSAFSVPKTKEGYRSVCSDAYPLFHKQSGKLLCTGAVNRYADKKEPVWYPENSMFYAVYDENERRYQPIKYINVPKAESGTNYWTGSAQFIEDGNGDLLIPIVIGTKGDSVWTGENRVTVLRCDFDGETVTVKEMGNILSFPKNRGLVEPQLCFHNGKYLLSLRNDDCALYSVGKNIKSFSEPEIWKWDTDEPLPSYNTQQHWLQCGGKLYLVYTRKAGNNDHVFRHRAPLFIAEADDVKMRIMRHTEKIAVPERGARLGNFGVCRLDETNSLICVSEWMQPAGCERFGSDNSVFITRVTEE